MAEDARRSKHLAEFGEKTQGRDFGNRFGDTGTSVRVLGLSHDL
jgi:hypothetical protein